MTIRSVSRRARGLATSLTLLALLVLTARDGDAQRAAAIGLSPDSLAKLSAPLSAKAKGLLARFLSAPDTAVSDAVGDLASDATAGDLVLALAGADSRSEIRGRIIRGMPYRAHLASHPYAIQLLRDRIRNDPDTGVVLSAVEVFPKIAIMNTGIRSAIADRAATSQGDDAFRRKLLEADELAMYAGAGVLAPKFLLGGGKPFAAAPAGEAIRFMAFGDYGTAHLGDPRYRSHQAALSTVMRSYHKKRPLTFGITTGDNFYPTSFPSPEDPSWEKSWSSLYDPLGIPFYISIGNHDWGERDGPLSQHVYGRKSKSWKLPAYYYTYTAGPVQFFAINTNALTERQLNWLREELGKSTAKWKVVYGHFPVYEQMNNAVDLTRPHLEPIFKQYGVDMYMCGHHHTMEHWTIGGVDYVVTGAGGAGNYGLGDTTVATPGKRFLLSAPGFAVVDASSSALTLRFIGANENVLYEYTRRK